MFNLFRSRDKAVRYLLGGLLVLVSLSMLTYLIPSYNTGSSGSDFVVAEIGREKITEPEVRQNLQAVLRGKQLPPEFLPHYIPQLVENLVVERAMVYEARRLGFNVSENDLIQGIRTMVPSLFADGKFVGRDTYAAMLAQQNLTIPEFELNIERQLLINRLRTIVLAGVVVSPQEIQNEYHMKNDKVKVEYVKISADKFLSSVKPTPDDLHKWYDAHRGDYQVPQKRSLGILVIAQARLEQAFHPTDADLLRVYNQIRDRYRTQDRVKVRHILLTTTGKTKPEEAAIKAKAEKLLQEIHGGADFAKLAKENSQDPGSAQNGGELGWVTRGQTVPEFEKTAFSLKPGETSDLVKTQYGFHILRVEGKESARLKPFEEVKAEIASEYTKQQVGNEMQLLTDKAQAALKKDPLHPDKVAASLGLEYVKVDSVAPGDPLPQVGVNKDFEESLSGLKAGEVSQPVLLPGNRVVLASVTAILPPHPATYEEAQSSVSQALTNDKLTKIVAQKAQELADKTKSMNGDLAKAAQSLNLEVKTAPEVTRQGAVEGLGSASMISDAFVKPVGTVVGPLTLGPSEKLLVKVLAHVDADPAALAAQQESLREELKSRKAQSREKLFEEGLVEALIQQGKVKIHNDVVQRLSGSYRG